MDDMNTMLEQSSLPGPLCRWLKYLRTPGVTLQYTIEKHHIPDMNAAPAEGSCMGKSADNGANQSGATTGKNTNGDNAFGASDASQNAEAATDASGASSTPDGKDTGCTAKATDTADNMQLIGSLRARYFDLAAGMLGIVAVCCLIKGCMCGCRCIRKHMC